MLTKARAVGALLASLAALCAHLPAAQAQQRPAARHPGWPTPEEDGLLWELQHSEYQTDRIRAAVVLREMRGGPSLRVVPGLLTAMSREDYPEPFAAMLLTLGASGAREAWPILVDHLHARNDEVSAAAEEGLERWYVRNWLAVPEAPATVGRDPFAGLSPRAPASRPIHEWLGYRPAPLERAPTPSRERRSQAARVSGIVIASMGAGAILTSPLGFISSDESTNPIGVSMLAGGAAAVVAGGLMTILGGQWIRVEPRPRGEAWVPVVRIHGTSGTLSWTY